MPFWCLLCFLMIFSTPLISQAQLHGVVVDAEGKAVENANVLLKVNNKIVHFAMTDSKGKYALDYKSSDISTSTLEVNHMSFIVSKKKVLLPNLKYDFNLELKVKQLDELKIGKPIPIRPRKDTLSFSVRAFADSMDRSIGDVLSRMPGFKVSENGKISFNGQDISHFFIDGDDLLGNNYGLGTRKIPHDIIHAIEVYRNHQNVKALEGKLNSNQIALNLKVKDSGKYHWVGEAALGLGLPKQYFADVNALMLHKKLKTLNAIMANNVGDDVEYGLQALSQINHLNNVNFLLKGGVVDAPNASKSSFYNNNSLGLFNNLLLNIKDSLSLRINLGAYLDKSFMNNFSNYSFFTPDKTIENQSKGVLTYKPVKLDFRLVLLKNRHKSYLNNQLQFKWGIYQSSDSIRTLQTTLSNQVKQQNLYISNQLNFIPNNKSSNVFQIKWNTDYSYIPENLWIDASSGLTLFPTIDIRQVQQHLMVKIFNSVVDGSYLINSSGFIKQRYGLEVAYNKVWLESDNDLPIDTMNFKNNLDWNKYSAQVFGDYQFNKGRWKVNFRLPVGIQWIYYQDRFNTLKNSMKRPLFNPMSNVQFVLNSNNRLTADFFQTQFFGQYTDVYRAYILTDFRTLRHSNSILPFNSFRRLSSSYIIEDPIKMSFAKLSYTLDKNNQNVMTSLDISQDAINLDYIAKNNSVTDQQLGLSWSKFIRLFSGSIAINTIFGKNNSEQLLNNQEVSIQTHRIEINPSILSKYKSLQATYQMNLSWNWMDAINTGLPERGFIQNHSLKLTNSYKSKLFSSIEGRVFAIKNNQSASNQFLLSSNFRYKLKNKNELAFTFYNIFNQKRAETYMLSPGIAMHEGYDLRGMFALGKYTLSF